ncbi:Serine carboxypeptidase-like 35 [Nymphaea thermarum]|nr:Serine carboxypeptidase-like 35 [Nymphaea thermarum]
MIEQVTRWLDKNELAEMMKWRDKMKEHELPQVLVVLLLDMDRHKKANLLFLELLVRVGFSYTNTSSDIPKLGDRITGALHLLFPIFVSEFNRQWDLLLPEEGLAKEAWQEWNNLLVSEEEVIRAAELPPSLEGAVVSLQLGKFQHL